jgi:hypothetical protein
LGLLRELLLEGRLITVSGLDIRFEIWEAVSERGLKARFLRGRLERGSAEVGMLSGIGSDILVVVWL